MKQAHAIMNDNPNLGQSITEAIKEVDGIDPEGHYMAPLNHEMYYQSQEGQEDRDQDDDEPMGFKIRRNLSDSS